MLTGQPLFTGETVSHVLASVLKTDPDWKTLPHGASAPLRKLLRRCLDRNPKRRLRDVREIRIAVEEALAAPLSPEGQEVVAARLHIWQQPVVLAIGALVLVAITSFVWSLASDVPAVTARRIPATHFSLATPQGVTLGYDRDNPSVTISPEGQQLVYVGSSARGQQLYLHDLDRPAGVEPIPGTEGAVNPFFSSDGEWVCFVADGKLQKVALNGGTPFELANTSSLGGFKGGAWSLESDLIPLLS